MRIQGVTAARLVNSNMLLSIRTLYDSTSFNVVSSDCDFSNNKDAFLYFSETINIL